MTREIVRARCAMQRARASIRRAEFLAGRMDGRPQAIELVDLATRDVVRAVVSLLRWGLSWRCSRADEAWRIECARVDDVKADQLGLRRVRR